MLQAEEKIRPDMLVKDLIQSWLMMVLYDESHKFRRVRYSINVFRDFSPDPSVNHE